MKCSANRRTAWMIGALLALAPLSRAQTCLTTGDIDAPTKSALATTAQNYFDMVARGDAAALRQNAIAGLAGNFAGVENAIRENQPTLSGSQAALRPPFVLQADGTAPLERAEFFCGVFGASGQTSDSAVLMIPNLPPGKYALAIEDANTSKGPYSVSFVLQQEGASWKLGGLYIKAKQAAGHDAPWFMEHARQYKAKGQLHNAWFYYLEARELMVPVPFMTTQATDKLYDELQSSKPADLPSSASPIELKADTKSFRVTDLFPLPVGNDLDVVARFQSADVSNTSAAFRDNMAVIRALAAKYPELREAFAGVVARGVEPSGRDYGSMLQMKDIK